MRNKFVYLGLPLILILAIGGGFYAWQKYDASAESSEDLAIRELEELPAPAAGADIGDISGAEDASVTETPATENTQAAKAAEIHVTAMGMTPSEPRSIGDMSAPITIEDFSSLTCPHCAHAHQTVLPQLIKDYVETGKVRIVFKDFPLNQQAFDATKISRCMAGDQYFPFMTWAFENIQQWAYTDMYPNLLVQTATKYGLTEDQVKTCMADTIVESAVVTAMRDAGEKYKIDSTPTFVFNDGKKILKGARPYAEFKTVIDELLAPAQ